VTDDASTAAETAVADDILTRLRYAARTCGHGWPNGTPDHLPDPITCGACVRLDDAADEIERLRAALRLAAVEVYGSCDPLTTSPDDLARHFYEEARP